MNFLPIPDDCFEMVLAYDGRYDKNRLIPSLRIIDIRLVVKPDNITEEMLFYLGEPSPKEKNEYYKFIETQTMWAQQRCYHKKQLCNTDTGTSTLLNDLYAEETKKPKFRKWAPVSYF